MSSIPNCYRFGIKYFHCNYNFQKKYYEYYPNLKIKNKMFLLIKKLFYKYFNFGCTVHCTVYSSSGAQKLVMKTYLVLALLPSTTCLNY